MLSTVVGHLILLQTADVGYSIMYTLLYFFTTSNLCILTVWAGLSGSGRRQELLSPPSADTIHGREQPVETMGHPAGNARHGML